MTDAKSKASASEATPYSLSVIGIGRSGAGYVDGLLRTGEIEDVLMDPRARVAALVIDVGDSDLKACRRLCSRPKSAPRRTRSSIGSLSIPIHFFRHP